MISIRFFRGLSAALGLAGALLAATPAHAVPSFARQTGQDCAACHIGAYGPQLTPYGTRFKIGGYTDSDGKSGKVPVSGMVVASFTHTSKDQPEKPASGYSKNDNFALDEASLFLAGKLADNIGAFVQVTYDGIGESTALDQMDFRFANTTEFQGKDLTFGLSLNNNPGVQDPWNTMPIWSFPYVGTALGYGGPDAASLINGGLEQRVMGVSAYAFYDKSWYAELGTYRSLSTQLQGKLGLDKSEDPGKVHSGSAYWRLAYMQDLKSAAWSVGVFGLHAEVQPDRHSGPSNSYNDVGVDAQYQYLGTREHIFTVQSSFIRERQGRDALFANGEASNSVGYLNEFKLNTSYNFRQTWGATVGYFSTIGSSDELVYADNIRQRPNTQGETVQLDWTPFGKEDSWGAPWANVRLGAQYTHFSKYNGASNNYDGTGRNASNNDTLFLFAWTSF